MEAFYNALSDEQKARFNEIGPRIAQQRGRSTDPQRAAQAACSGDKAGLSSLPIERIEEVVQPTDAQSEALDRLDEALQKAVDALNQACPTTIPQTPVGRLEVMEQRLEAMIAAANAVRPALDDFYASLSSEQKAKFNRLGRDTARSGG
jgi:ribosomal protein L20A (L18A)